LEKWFDENISPLWCKLRIRMLQTLQDEAELEEIVKLVGMDSLSPQDRLKMEVARSIREDFLHQLAFHEVDTYTSLEKQFLLMRLIFEYYDEAVILLKDGGNIEEIVNIPVREAIGRFKYVKEEEIHARYADISEKIRNELKALAGKEEI
jgi:V/A-type H+-transporting ATPase subunit A